MSFGTKLGRAIGATAAYAGHVAIVAVEGSGRFGADVLTGVELGYDEKHAALVAKRAEAAAKRDAMAAKLAAAAASPAVVVVEDAPRARKAARTL